MKLSSLQFFAKLRWLDGTPLLSRLMPWERRLLPVALDTPRYNQVLQGAGKKNNKTLKLILAGLYSLICRESPQGSQCYILANDSDQAADDLDLCKKLLAANPWLARHLVVKLKSIVRRDGRGQLDILPAGDIAGSHGKTYVFCGFDEIHSYKDWGILEALQGDPTRRDGLMWITSYASLYHRPGIPLYDLVQLGKAGTDPRMLFSWYAADFTTDPDFVDASPEERANPCRALWADPDYLAQQQRRLPSHLFRRLHLNLPGLPEGSAYQLEPLQDAIPRGTRQRPPEPGIVYSGFVDMSGGSQDDATLGIAHVDADGRAVLDYIGNQGSRPPFDPRHAVGKFAGLLKQYNVGHIALDRYAGQVFPADFAGYGIPSEPALLSASDLYAAFEPALNGHRAVLLDHPVLESQLLGLIWRGNKIVHPSGEHDDWANAAVGALLLALQHPGESGEAELVGVGEIPEDELAEQNFLRGW